MPIPGYRILGVLGCGAMGIVYKAEQVGLNRIVALKMIPSDPEIPAEARTRFQREAEAVARLRHPNIVQIYEIGSANDVPFISLEFIDGGTLAGRLARGPLTPKETVGLIETLARAMAYTHQQGIIHRDLKPANILLSADGQPKVADFGLAKNLNAAVLTHTNAILGTPCYMPPEQAVGRKDIGSAADVYALGAILYHCLTGRPPFKGSTVAQTLEQVQTLDPVPPSKLCRSVPRDLNIVCLKCLRKEPAQRYGSALELAEDLTRVRTGDPVHAQPEPLLRKASRAGRRHFWALLIATGVSTLLSIQMGLLLGLFSITSIPIDYTHADVWMGAPQVPSVDLGRPIPESMLERMGMQPEIERCELYLHGFAHWSAPKGGIELCMVIGSQLSADSLGKIDILTPEQCGLLAEEGTVIIDESDAKRLGVEVGKTAEISSQPVRVVSATRGLPSLSGPYVLCSISTARKCLPVHQGRTTTYVLGRCSNRQDAPKVVDRLNRAYQDVTAFTQSDFSRQTRLHWLSRTKAGIALGYAALLLLGSTFMSLWRSFSSDTVTRLRAGSVREDSPSYWRIISRSLVNALGVGLTGGLLSLPVMFGVAFLLNVAMGVRIVHIPFWVAVFSMSMTVCTSFLAALGVVLRVFLLRRRE